ncbi:MAG: bifunctional metallophosphatase/5'-nucleotidase [Alistipes sp.]|nr:bifunctional metallophosphatase/5'-nucleotidase [Alistipes sp.]
MKRTLYALCLILLLVPAGFALYSRSFAQREIVILSTNDIHANIKNFARLATAVKECRDTVATLLVDAGDRWTGNAFVDLAPEPRKPIIDLMNELGYDVATFGNHEFDGGSGFLRDMLQKQKFATVCANIEVFEGDFPQVPPYVVVEVDGARVGVAGAVTNYANGYPDGKESSFVGLRFPDPQQRAAEVASELKGKCDVSVLLSHMGWVKDIELAAENDGYDLIISGHTHVLADTLVNRTVIGQTRKNLIAVGATTIRMKGRKIESIEYKNHMLTDFEPDSLFAARVAEITADPHLNEAVGENSERLDHIGLGKMQASIVRDAVGAEVGFYHYGGVRLAELPIGAVSRATLFDLEPFFSTVASMTMTPKQMRQMIITKFNDTGNVKESHRVDLYSTVPYDIITDNRGEAVDVIFPTLREGRRYKVGMCNYIAETYRGIEADDKVICEDILVLDKCIEFFDKNSPVKLSNKPLQRIVRP